MMTNMERLQMLQAVYKSVEINSDVVVDPTDAAPVTEVVIDALIKRGFKVTAPDGRAIASDLDLNSSW